MSHNLLVCIFKLFRLNVIIKRLWRMRLPILILIAINIINACIRVAISLVSLVCRQDGYFINSILNFRVPLLKLLWAIQPCQFLMPVSLITLFKIWIGCWTDVIYVPDPSHFGNNLLLLSSIQIIVLILGIFILIFTLHVFFIQFRNFI